MSGAVFAGRSGWVGGDLMEMVKITQKDDMEKENRGEFFMTTEASRNKNRERENRRAGFVSDVWNRQSSFFSYLKSHLSAK